MIRMALTSRSRKKSRKLRGRTRSMGWGRIGQHRKSGSKGGTGGSGMNKHRRSWALKYYPNWYGKKGFTSPRDKKSYEKKIVTLEELSNIIYHMAKDNGVRREGDKMLINLKEMGYEKLIGKGKVYDRLKIFVKKASRKAIEKVKESGGEIIAEEIAEEGS